MIPINDKTVVKFDRNQVIMRASLGTWLLQISNLSKSKLEVMGFKRTVK